MNYLFAALIASIVVLGGLNILQAILHHRERVEVEKLHYEEKADIFNRYMAGDYKTYEYFKKEFPVEVEDKKEKLEAEREKKPTELELELKKRGTEY